MKRTLCMLMAAFMLFTSMGSIAKAAEPVTAPDILEYNIGEDVQYFNSYRASDLGIRQARCFVTTKAYALDDENWTKITMDRSANYSTKTEYLQIEVSKMAYNMGSVEIMVMNLDTFSEVALDDVGNNEIAYIKLPKNINYAVYARGTDNPGVVYLAVKSIFL